jgi:hypothetical protein
MEYCKFPVILADVLIIYLISSVLYLILTANIGTPFRDSLTPEQLKIKNESSKIRSKIFYGSVIGVAAIVFTVKPFKKCLKK